MENSGKKLKKKKILNNTRKIMNHLRNKLKKMDGGVEKPENVFSFYNFFLVLHSFGIKKICGLQTDENEKT